MTIRKSGSFVGSLGFHLDDFFYMMMFVHFMAFILLRIIVHGKELFHVLV